MVTTNPYDTLNMFEQLVNNVFQPQRAPVQPATEGEYRESRLIRTDVSESNEAYFVQAELPGLRKEDIEITIEGKQVLLQAESKREVDAENAPRSLLSERFYGKWTRRLQLPHEIDNANAKASFSDGVLNLTLPKVTASVKRIEIA